MGEPNDYAVACNVENKERMNEMKIIMERKGEKKKEREKERRKKTKKEEKPQYAEA